MSEPQFGRITDPKNMYLRSEAVKFHDGDEELRFEGTLVNGHIPMITSRKTGKNYLLPWPDILEMAIAAGVDEPDDKEEQDGPAGRTPDS